MPYLDHYGLVKIKSFALEIITFWNTFNTSLWNLGFKMIQGRLLSEDLRYTFNENVWSLWRSLKNKFNQGYYKVWFNLAFAKIALNVLKIEQGVQQMPLQQKFMTASTCFYTYSLSFMTWSKIWKNSLFNKILKNPWPRGSDSE